MPGKQSTSTSYFIAYLIHLRCDIPGTVYHTAKIPAEKPATLLLNIVHFSRRLPLKLLVSFKSHEESLQEKKHTHSPRPTPYLLRYWPIGDFDLLRQGNTISSLSAWASCDLTCPHPSGHGAPSPLPCHVRTRRPRGNEVQITTDHDRCIHSTDSVFLYN